MAFKPSFLCQATNILKAFFFSPLLSSSKQVLAAWRPPNFSHLTPSSRDRSSNSSTDGPSVLTEAEDNNGRRRKKLEKGGFKYLANDEQWWRKVKGGGEGSSARGMEIDGKHKLYLLLPNWLLPN